MTPSRRRSMRSIFRSLDRPRCQPRGKYDEAYMADQNKRVSDARTIEA